MHAQIDRPKILLVCKREQFVNGLARRGGQLCARVFGEPTGKAETFLARWELELYVLFAP